MTRNLRPVRTEWGPHSSCFLEPEAVGDVLVALADLSLGHTSAQYDVTRPFAVSRHDREEEEEIWIQKGGAFLEYLSTHSPQQLMKAVDRYYEQEGETDPDTDVATVSLLSNLQSLVGEWFTFLESDGVLRIYVDSY